MNRKLSVSLLLFLLLQGSTAPPVTKNKSSDTDPKDNEVNAEETGLEDYMEYHRYLKEVVDALESDPQFREKLEKAEESDIRSGQIAHELEYVSHKVRSRLDELKRTELERLRHLASKQYELENGLNTSQGKVGTAHSNEHVDHLNPHTFEIEDLKKLIAKSTHDLAEADKKRRQEFKEYEMQKEFEKQEKLKTADEAQREELEKQLKAQEEKHKKHEPLHHPGSKQQLEEVWEKQDHMDQQDFDPKTFFMLHDLDGNGVWDENEVKTLFIKELDKMYSEGAPEDDMRERIEEMERMREHVFGEVDRNKDGLISYEEFLDQTKKQDFQEDKGWEGLDQQKVYTDDEYKQFEKHRMEEIERLIAQGMLPPHPGAPVYHDPRVAGQNQFPPLNHHPGQVPSYQGHPPPQQMHPAAQYHPGQVPQYPHGQQHPAQVPQYPHGQQHPGQVPHQQPLHAGQGHPQAVPQQHYARQMPPQQQAPSQQQAPPQQQFNPQMSPNQPQQNAQAHLKQVPAQGNQAGQVETNEIPSNDIKKQQPQAYPKHEVNQNIPPQVHESNEQNNIKQPEQNKNAQQGSPQVQQV